MHKECAQENAQDAPLLCTDTQQKRRQGGGRHLLRIVGGDLPPLSGPPPPPPPAAAAFCDEPSSLRPSLACLLLLGSPGTPADVILSDVLCLPRFPATGRFSSDRFSTAGRFSCSASERLLKSITFWVPYRAASASERPQYGLSCGRSKGAVLP